MEKAAPRREKSHKKSTIGKEFVLGLVAIVLGGYNILAYAGLISVNVEVPQIIANILLLLTGLLLWANAYKLSRYKYHAKHFL